MCNDNRKIIETFLEKIENVLKENTTETLVSKLEKDKEKINKKLNNLLELNLEGRINKEQYYISMLSTPYKLDKEKYYKIKRVVNKMIILISVIILILLIRLVIYIKQNKNLKINIRKYIKLNDIEHYLTIRGKNNNTSVLITLHGGPNCSLIPYSFVWQKELENNYIVVNYDQRLCGRTAMKNKNIKNATQDELIEDLKCLIDYLKNMFKVDKVTLLGHSGGTMLGIDFMEKYPELVEKYVGISQIYNFKEAIIIELKKVLDNQKLSYKDKANIDKILENYKCINSVQEITRAINYILKYSKQPEPIFKLLILPIISPYMGFKDLWYFTHCNKGNEKYGFLKFNLEDKLINSNIKYTFILGEDDYTICPNLIKEYAKSKENINVYCIKECGHVPMYLKTKEFNKIMKGL